MTEKLELAFHSCHTRGSQDNQDSHDQDSNGDGDCQEGERKRLRGGRHSCHTKGIMMMEDDPKRVEDYQNVGEDVLKVVEDDLKEVKDYFLTWKMTSYLERPSGH